MASRCKEQPNVLFEFDFALESLTTEQQQEEKKMVGVRDWGGASLHVLVVTVKTLI